MERLGRERQPAELEAGVAQAVPEGVARLDRAVVIAPVSHEDALAIAKLTVFAGEVVVGRAVLEPVRDGHG